MDALVFYISGLLMIASALLVVTRKNPVYSAILLVVFFLLTSVNFLVLRSPFLAVIQVLVYGGAIMVLFLFVLMLLNLTEEELEEKVEPGRKLLGADSRRRRGRPHREGRRKGLHRRRNQGDRRGSLQRTHPAVRVHLYPDLHRHHRRHLSHQDPRDGETGK